MEASNVEQYLNAFLIGSVKFLFLFLFLVILIFQSSSDIDIGDMKQHLMFVHAINGRDIVSAPYMKGNTLDVR